MRKNILLMAAVLVSVALSGCGGDSANTNVHVNANRSTTNTVMNTVSNAVNTVSNAVSNTAASVTTDSPEDFLKMAARGGMAEVEMGKAASTKAQDPEVKKFGEMMVADHGKANTELKALAAKMKIELPTDIGEHKKMLVELNGKSGAEFDKAYVEQMVDDHEADVDAFSKQAINAKETDLKVFAAKTLPVLKKHLEAIKAIQAKMK